MYKISIPLAEKTFSVFAKTLAAWTAPRPHARPAPSSAAVSLVASPLVASMMMH